jgi:MoaA/NifB/PqqE/SkfB family radical SAM enzyme
VPAFENALEQAAAGVEAPTRLNLAIARRCEVSCPGCFTFFGAGEPDLPVLLASVQAFVGLGIRDVTVAGGDPLTIEHLLAFLRSLRRVGVHSVKLDTVGVGLGPRTGIGLPVVPALEELTEAVDLLGVPLDSWTDASALTFRQGRPRLHSELVALLDCLDRLRTTPKIVVNTVVHRANVGYLDRIADEVLHHRSVCHWNLFQYTPTDRAPEAANARLTVADGQFVAAANAFLSRRRREGAGAASPCTQFHTNLSRLGRYLLVNSDGEAWIPDERGTTVRLGHVPGNERQVIGSWKRAVGQIRARMASDRGSSSEPPSGG